MRLDFGYGILESKQKWLKNPKSIRNAREKACLFNMKNKSSRSDSSLLARKVEKMVSSQPDDLPGLVDLFSMQLGWGNFGYMANIRYLQEIALEVRRSRGPVLECGSGLTTILIAALTASRKTPVFALEHHEEWFNKMRNTLDSFGFDHVRVLLTPLRDFGAYDWYDVPKQTLPKGFDLVICDGPPGNIKGSRYGLIPEMNHLLSPECVILLDDANRRKEKQVIQSWEQKHGFASRKQGVFKKFASVNRVPAAPASGVEN